MAIRFKIKINKNTVAGKYVEYSMHTIIQKSIKLVLVHLQCLVEHTSFHFVSYYTQNMGQV